MKKIISTLFIASILCILTACSGGKDSSISAPRICLDETVQDFNCSDLDD